MPAATPCTLGGADGAVIQVKGGHGHGHGWGHHGGRGHHYGWYRGHHYGCGIIAIGGDFYLTAKKGLQ
jgi:hypothetical protein